MELWEREFVTECGKLIGFAGPVLAESDPVHLGVEQLIGRLRVRQNFRLPRRFWKVIVAANAAGKLSVAAFLLDQDALVHQKVPVKSSTERFRATVVEIEAATGIDFGTALREAPAIPT